MSDDYDDDSPDWCASHAISRRHCGCSYDNRTRPDFWFSQVIGIDELAELPEPEPLIDGTLDRRTVALLAGPWGSGKTFVALDWALSVASGKAWQRRDVAVEHGDFVPDVLYVAAEGAYGLKQRVKAWQAAWNVDDGRLLGFLVIPRPVMLATSDVASFCAYIRQGDHKFVVIDTLARCAVGLDENSAKDAGLIVRDLDRIRDATNGGTVLVVHHTGKDGKTVRGSSAFEAAMDTVYQIEGDPQLMKLRRTKRKDGPTPDNLSLRLEAVPGTDSVVVSGGRVDTTPTVEKLMSTFVQAFSETGASRADLRSAADMSPGSFHRGLNRALQDGLLVNVGTDQRPFYRLGRDAK